ncbi:hypothetical protein JCM11491_002145 [Sporobolomyces phaffii]
MATVTFDDLGCTNRLASLPISALNEIYSSLVHTTVSENDSSTRTGIGTRGPVTRFHSKVPPPLPIRDYLARLTKFTPFPRDALLLSSVYLNRISHLALATAYSACGEAFVDDPLPPPGCTRTPQPLVPTFSPPRPEPVVVVSPLVLPTSASSRSNSSGSLPSFSLSASPPPPTPPPPPGVPSTSQAPPSPNSAARASSSRHVRPAPLLNQFTLHRVLLATLLVATKYSVDGTLSQSRAAKVGGVTTTELTRLEAECLRLLGWSLYVHSDELERVLAAWVARGHQLGVLPPPPSPPPPLELSPLASSSSSVEGDRRQDEEDEEAPVTTTRGRGRRRRSAEPTPLPPSPPLPTVPPASSFSHAQFLGTTDRLSLPAASRAASSSSAGSSSTSSPSITFSPPPPPHDSRSVVSMATRLTTSTTDLTPPSSPGTTTSSSSAASNDGKPPEHEREHKGGAGDVEPGGAGRGGDDTPT